MRIIAGEKRGTKLFGPSTDKIRPTTDRAKESLFNLIGFKISNSIFLDLYSGSGSIALEAKSRGASKVTCVDKSRESCELIKMNIDKTKLDINFYQKNVESFINTCDEKFDIIFMDPPFDVDVEIIIDKVESLIKNNLNESGLCIIERHTNKENKEKFKHLNAEVRKYGKIEFIMIGER